MISYRVRNAVKTSAGSNTTSKPHQVVGDCLTNVTEYVDAILPKPLSLKRTVQRKRRADAVTSNHDLVLACDRSLYLLHIPETFLQPWKYYDSGPNDARILM